MGADVHVHVGPYAAEMAGAMTDSYNTGLAPGAYYVTTSLQDAEGRTLASLRREMVVPSGVHVSETMKASRQVLDSWQGAVEAITKRGAAPD